MRYRFASPDDLLAYDEMLRGYLLEEQKCGSPVRMTLRTIAYYRQLGRCYAAGALAGCLVFAEVESPVGFQPIGFVLAGESGSRPALDFAHGRTAQVWIAWVHPDHRREGLGFEMLVFGEPRLVALGFERAEMGVREGNDLGQALSEAFGAELVERFYAYALGRTDHGRRRQAVELSAAAAGPGDL